MFSHKKSFDELHLQLFVEKKHFHFTLIFTVKFSFLHAFYHIILFESENQYTYFILPELSFDLF